MNRPKSWISWRPLFSQGRHSSANRRPQRTPGPRLGLEVLENRTLLSSGSPLIAPIASNDVQPTDGPTPLVLQSLSYFSVVDGATLIPSSVTITTPPSHGTATVDPTTGNITYIAAAGFAGTDMIGFTAADSDGLTSLPAYVNEIVTLPVANPDSAGTEAGQPVTIPVLSVDASVAAPLNPATVAVTSAPAHGATSINPSTGSITYTSVQGFSGTDTFTYTVEDANGVVSNPATVSVVVSRPQANDDFATTPEGTAVVIPVLSQDTGPSSLVPSSVTIIGAPADGSASVNSSTGSVTYTPNAGFHGADSFTYTVTDVNGAVSNTAKVSIAVQAPLSGTVVNPIATSTSGSTPVTIDELAVDNSPVGLAPNTVVVQSAPTHGSTTVNSTNGDIAYTPAAGFTGTDDFTYSVEDNNGNPAGTATIAVVVEGPQANDSFGVTSAGQSVIIPVLAADNDVDNPLVPSTVTITTAPAHGTATVNPTNGDVTYTANASFAGTDSFAYTVEDANHVVSNPATVTVIANRPGASDEFGTTDSGYAITIDTLASDTDPAGPSALVPSSVTILSGPSNGTATIDPTTGDITYKSIFGFNGTDTMTYTVKDTSGAVSNVGTISIVVNRPTAEPDSGSTTENTPVVIDVAANDSDPDGNQFLNFSSITVTTPAGHGFVSLDAAVGGVTYTPNYGFVGTDTFAYTIADAHGATSNPAFVMMTVTGSQSPSQPILFLPTQPNAPAPAGQSSNALYVGGLYRDILGRPADTTGLDYWVNQLQSGVSRATVAQAFLNSPEHLSAEVTSYYQSFLNRAPDSVGLAYWVSKLEAGASEQQVIAGILSSTEFLSAHSSSALFVNALYSDLLDRTADGGGLASWEAALNAGTMTDAQVVQGFLNSKEAQTDVVDSYYAAFLGRPADTVGATGWVSALQNGTATLDSVAIGFLTSTEYANDLAVGFR
jgi:hypothetical protein